MASIPVIRANGRHRARRLSSHGPSPSSSNGKKRPLHRIAQVRRRQGVSLRTAARQWNVALSEVRQQQREDSDLSLSELYRWQELLNVPVDELLEDCDLPLSRPVLERARLLKMMKTAASIRESSSNHAVQRLVGMLIDQLIEIMPELSEVGSWQSNGSRRTLDDLGRAASYHLSEEVLVR